MDLRKRRTVGDKPPVLLLGAGASVDAGIGAMPALYKFFGCDNDFKAFCKYIDTLDAAERYRYLSEFLQTRRPADVSPGYQALASLCAQTYFDLVLTTNMDPLLDDALAAARLWRRDYMLIVNGVIRHDRLKLLLSGQSPRVKIVKLHGDLFQRFMAWTEAEMDTFLTEVSPQLKPAVYGRDFLIVGYSLRDVRVRELVESAGGSVWFTHHKKVPDHLKGMAKNKTFRAVVAPECAFEKFFPSLAQALQLDVPQERLDAALLELGSPAAAAKGALTMDDLMASVFALAEPDGIPMSTAFLLAEPRVIVCDRYASVPFIKNGEAELIASGGRRFKAQLLCTNETHPFGPTILRPPASLQVPGLRITLTLMKPGNMIQVLVAAGEKTGISTGTVKKAQLDPMPIDPIDGKVRNLAALECVVAPGSSGAPVVDDSMAVRGFIVAGSMDPDHPRSFAYPAKHWALILDESQAKPVRRSKNASRKR
jgi:hypothetical protein